MSLQSSLSIPSRDAPAPSSRAGPSRIPEPVSLRADSAFRARNWQVAATAYSSIVEKAPTQGLAWIRLGIARKGNRERAFGYLDQLVPLGGVPLSILDTLSDIASLRSDARYKTIADRITAARFPCRGLAEAHQFDFWIGDWDVTPWQAPASSNPAVIGTNRIEPILEHCVVMENWQGLGRLRAPESR